MSYDVVNLGNHRFRFWLGVCLAPSHYLKQCWHISHQTLRNVFQGNFIQNSNIVIQNGFEIVVCKRATVSFRLQWVTLNVVAMELIFFRNNSSIYNRNVLPSGLDKSHYLITQGNQNFQLGNWVLVKFSKLHIICFETCKIFHGPQANFF